MAGNHRFDLDSPDVSRKLAFMGIDSRSLENLPEDTIERLKTGGLTPIIDIKVNNNDNIAVNMPVKFQLAKNSLGQTQLLVYPVNHRLKNSMNVTEASFQKLKEGEVVIVSNKSEEKVFIQLDRETNNFISVKEKDLKLDEKIKDIEKVKDIELGTDQKNMIKSGRPVELKVGEEKITIGLDLREPDTFRELKGDLETWKRRKEIEYDLLHPEYLGPVHTDRNRWEYMMAKRQNSHGANKKLNEVSKQTRPSGIRI